MINRLNKFLLAGASPALLMLASAMPAFAQSTGTQEIETVTVTGVSTAISGIMKPITVPKERSTITQDFINSQPAGQSVFETLNTVPGFNFTNNDPYGNSGGDVRVHGFDGNHVSFTWDGMPLNDTGNYATYTNQVADAELIASASVNQGTTDVDSPTAAATGGVIAITTARPKDEFGAQLNTSYGSWNYFREMARIDTGAFGPWNTTALIAASYTDYDKFKGPGSLRKEQLNAELYQDLGARGWVQLAAHWNSNRNNFYNNPSYYPVVVSAAGTTPAGQPFPTIGIGADGNYLGTVSANSPLPPNGPSAGTALQGRGFDFDESPTCVRVPGGAGAQNDALCTNYYGVRINPSDTGNIRMSSLFHITDDIALTVDPSIQYVLANGGGYTFLSEKDAKLIGNSTAAGKDLNGDGDTLDTVGVYSPSNTNTIRYGLNSSLVWHVDDENTLQFAYTLDYGLHRQTGQMSFLDGEGKPYDPFGGYSDIDHRVTDVSGTPIRGRDRRSHAILNQFALAYEGGFLEDALHVSAGVRLPFLTRELNNLCYEQVTGSSAGFPTCTTAAPATTNAANNTVTLAGISGALFVKPAQETVKYNKVLPNLGFTWSPFDGRNVMLFADYAQGLAAPRTDNLYNGGNNGKCVTAGASNPNAAGCVYSSFSTVQPETSTNYDLGVRYNSDLVTASLTLYNTQFKNRIVTSFDQDLGISVDRNIGSVNVDGVDVEADLFPVDNFSIYTSASYEHSRVSSSPFSTLTFSLTPGAPTVNLAGNTVVETPAWTVTQRYQYKVDGFTLGFGFKYVSSRFATDANDLKIPSYVTANGDITYDLGQLGWNGSYIKVNGFNLFNERYFGSISSKPCYNLNIPGCTSLPTVTVGSPQTFQVTLRTEF